MQPKVKATLRRLQVTAMKSKKKCTQCGDDFSTHKTYRNKETGALYCFPCVDVAIRNALAGHVEVPKFEEVSRFAERPTGKLGGEK